MVRSLSVRNKLIVSVSFILCIPCILIGWIAYQTSYRQLNEHTMESIQRNVQLLNANVQRNVELRERDVAFLAQTIHLDKLDKPMAVEDSAIRELIERHQALHPELNTTTVATENGLLMTAPKSTVLEPGYDPRQQLWYQRAMANPGRTIVTPPRMSKALNRLVVQIAAATSDRQGVVGIGLLLDDLTRSVNQINIARGGFVYIVDRDGSVVASTIEPIAEPAKGEHIPRILEQNAGTISFERDGKHKEAVFLTNELTGWKIVGEIDRQELVASVRPIFNTTLVVLLIAIFLTACLISLIVRTITRPLKELAMASERVSGGNFSEHVTITSNDEFQKLGETYNHMMDSLSQFALYDPLTMLPNRRQFTASLEQAVLQAAAQQGRMAIIFIDVDNFKRINDTLGHSVGDMLLQKFSDRLQYVIGSHGVAARFGGDEFVVLLQQQQAQTEYVELIASLLRDSCVRPLELQHQSIHVNMSMGIAVYPDHGKNGEELLKHADMAMYKAKELGKNNYQFFDREMIEVVTRKSLIEQLLRTALEKNEFSVHYQPQMDAATGDIRGFEALVRWDSPERGPISPVEFIPIAEEMGLIAYIDQWVMLQACRKNVELQQQFGRPYLMSVNISALQLKQRYFAENVEAILKETQMKPEHLEVEITESVLIESLESSMAALCKLESMGVKIALDDFGTGYSSLSYLKLLPIHTLKIDKSFVQGMTSASAEKAITESIIALVHKLGHGVVAEGVETEEQLRLLKTWNCDFVQGYFFSKPVAEDRLIHLITDTNALGAAVK